MCRFSDEEQLVKIVVLLGFEDQIVFAVITQFWFRSSQDNVGTNGEEDTYTGESRLSAAFGAQKNIKCLAVMK